MTGEVECRYCGRDFTAQEMALLRTLIAGPPPLNRHALSREYCRRIGWFKLGGGLKDMMARVTMLAMHKDGLIALPPPKWPRPPARPIVFGPDTDPPPHPAPTTLDEVRPLSLRTLVRYTSEGKRWNEFIPATTTSATRPWSAPRCATTTAKADPSPRSASALLRASSHHATASSVERRNCGRKPPPRHRQAEVPHPALDHYPQPRLPHSRHRPPALAPGRGELSTDDIMLPHHLTTERILLACNTLLT